MIGSGDRQWYRVYITDCLLLTLVMFHLQEENAHLEVTCRSKGELITYKNQVVTTLERELRDMKAQLQTLEVSLPLHSHKHAHAYTL